MKGKSLITAIGLSTLLLTGCAKATNESPKSLDIKDLEKAPKYVDYFCEIPMDHETGMAMSSGDFDGDGDLDLIVGARNLFLISDNEGKLYFFENDGKGNFKKREYPVKK